MLAELVILFVLLKEKCTIYGVKKRIDGYFSLFYSASLGSIHPAIKKLHSDNHLSVKKSVSPGGQRSSEYSITPSGKKYFEKIMLNPELSEQIVKIKLLILPELEKSLQVLIIKNIREYYREKLLDFEHYYENNPASYVRHCIDNITEEINWLGRQEFL